MSGTCSTGDSSRPRSTFSFVMGILGGIAATPYDLMNLHTTAERVLGRDYLWSVIGAGKNQFRQGAMGALMGSNVPGGA